MEQGTWAERLRELCTEVSECHSFEAVREKTEGIVRWWDMCEKYREKNSSPLGEMAMTIIKMQGEHPDVFPSGMSADWALDVQSAQTLDFLAALKASSLSEKQSVAWDLGTLTGISAAVLADHCDSVFTIERNPELAAFARKHLDNSKIIVVEGEIEEWLKHQIMLGNTADIIFMDLDKTAYEPIYKLISSGNGLLRPGGLLVADNVMYRGLPAQLDAGEDISSLVSEKTRLNAEALVRFNALIKKDAEAGLVRRLMIPVRDGMMAVMSTNDPPLVASC